MTKLDYWVRGNDRLAGFRVLRRLWYNQVPVISEAVANQVVNDDATIKPFTNIVLVDGDGDTISVTIILYNYAYGTLSASTVASGTFASVQATLREITFTPTPNRVPVGGTEMTTFTITANDGTKTQLLIMALQ